MSGSPENYSSTGSKGIFTGSFAAVDYAENLLANYDKVVMNTLKKAAREEQKKLREQASQSKTEWASIANKIRVRYNHETRQLDYGVKGGSATQNKAMALEYGTPQQPPVPLFRSSAISNQYDIENNINGSMNAEFMRGF